MRDNLPSLPSVRLAVGLGGSLDVWAGKVRRAPLLLQRLGLEWLWRMASQPRRLRQIPDLLRFAMRRRGGRKVVGLRSRTRPHLKVVGCAHTLPPPPTVGGVSALVTLHLIWGARLLPGP